MSDVFNTAANQNIDKIIEMIVRHTVEYIYNEFYWTQDDIMIRLS